MVEEQARVQTLPLLRSTNLDPNGTSETFDITFNAQEDDINLLSNPSHEDEHHDADRFKTMLALNAASVLEKTDEQLLPSVYKYVGCSLRNSTPASLAGITASRAVCQALASSLGGYLGYVFDRSLVTALGCFIWGTMTLLFSFTNSLKWGAFAWAWNGVGLSFIIPNSQSLVADYFTDDNRGKAFGVLYTSGALGGMLGSMFATNIAGFKPFGIDGWRVAFRVVALFAMVIGIAVLSFVKDPRYKRPSRTVQSQNTNTIIGEFFPADIKEARWRDAIADMFRVMKTPTFAVIILQGVLGSTPWNALVFLTVYLQLIGLSDFSASLVNSVFLAGASIGYFLGGSAGDWAARWDRDHGRIWVCQFSVSTGIPFTLILLKGMPYNGDTFTVVLYSVLMFFFGLVHTWAAPACNNPIFAEIVPPHTRNLVYAFDRSLEGALAALGAPLVGIIAERVFHFPQESTISCDPVTKLPVSSITARDHEKAAALGNAMLVCMLVPWSLCLLVYTLLHWTYPRDSKNACKVEKSLQRSSEILG